MRHDGGSGYLWNMSGQAVSMPMLLRAIVYIYRNNPTGDNAYMSHQSVASMLFRDTSRTSSKTVPKDCPHCSTVRTRYIQ